jgi:hypothetical protein
MEYKILKINFIAIALKTLSNKLNKRYVRTEHLKSQHNANEN